MAMPLQILTFIMEPEFLFEPEYKKYIHKRLIPVETGFESTIFKCD